MASKSSTPCQPAALRHERQPEEQRTEGGETAESDTRWRPANGAVRAGGRVPVAEGDDADERAERDRRRLPAEADPCDRNGSRGSGESEPGKVGRERAAHGEHGECDHGHGDQLEAVHPPRAGHVGRADREREHGHRHGRRQREPDPRSETAQASGAARARSRSRAGSTIGPGRRFVTATSSENSLVVEPSPPFDVLVSEVPDVRDRAAERRQTQPQGDREDLAGVACAGVSPVSRPASRAARRGPACALAARARMKRRSDSRFR